MRWILVLFISFYASGAGAKVLNCTLPDTSETRFDELCALRIPHDADLAKWSQDACATHFFKQQLLRDHNDRTDSDLRAQKLKDAQDAEALFNTNFPDQYDKQ